MSAGYKTKSIKDVQRENTRKMNQKKGEKKLVTYIAAGIVMILAVIYLAISITRQSYLLKVGNFKIGYVENRKAAMTLIEKAKKEIEAEIGTEIKIEEETSTGSTSVANKADSEEELIAKLKEKLTYQLKTYTLNINGNTIATLQSAKAVNEVLNEVKNKFDEKKDSVDFVENPENLKTWFKEDVKLETAFAKNTECQDVTEALKRINEQGSQPKTYEIQEGDTLSKIASDYDEISIDDLVRMNPGLKEKELKIGDKIVIGTSKVLLSVITREEKTYEDIVPKKVIIKENSDKYTTDRTVLKEGKDGKKTVTANIVKVNGIETGKEVLSEKILEEAVDETVEVGTKKLEARGYAGIFNMPTNGIITAKFGERRDGYNHKGVDIANDIGTPVFAAGSGTVCETGYDAGGYGNYIKVRHTNGFITLYGHLSKIYVKDGTEVTKKDKIGAMGDTGDSTGSHLHFEVMKNGEKLNPLKYIK